MKGCRRLTLEGLKGMIVCEAASPALERELADALNTALEAARKLAEQYSTGGRDEDATTTKATISALNVLIRRVQIQRRHGKAG